MQPSDSKTQSVTTLTSENPYSAASGTPEQQTKKEQVHRGIVYRITGFIFIAVWSILLFGSAFSIYAAFAVEHNMAAGVWTVFIALFLIIAFIGLIKTFRSSPFTFGWIAIIVGALVASTMIYADIKLNRSYGSAAAIIFILAFSNLLATYWNNKISLKNKFESK